MIEVLNYIIQTLVLIMRKNTI